MKKRTLILTLVIVITFTVGVFTGMMIDQQPLENLSIKEAPKSAKGPYQKHVPKNFTEHEKVLMGYVQDFRDPTMIDYKHLTHVIFSFAHPKKDGGLLLNGESALTNLRSIVSEAQNHHTKVMLAVGGWFHIEGGESYDFFREAITNPSSRTKLVNELISLTERENLDGIDIDFEHPRTKADAESLAKFTKDLSDKLHERNKEISIAVNAKIHSVAGTEINNVIYEPSMFQHVDHLNIMAYDGHWDGEYDAANLSPYPFNENIVNYWSSLFDAHGLSKEKLVLGVPFYAQPENPDIKQVSYAAIIQDNPENANHDIVNMNGTTYHYNGEETVQKKTKLALDHGFGGMMLWEAGHDADGPNSLTIAISRALQDSNDLTYQ